MNRTNTFNIRTPEGIVFSQLLAGPVPRFLAWLIDFFCLLFLVIVVNLVMLPFALVSPDLMQALSLLTFFVLSLGYGMVLEWSWRGQTIGKRFLRLRVVDAQGLRLHASQIVIRNLLRVVDMLPLLYLTGGLTCLCTRRAQRLGDIAANTVVIRTPKMAEPDLEQLLAGRYNSLRQFPHLEARLRQRVSPSEAAVAMQALLRRDQLEPESRVELFARLADHFRSVVTFPLEATEGIADEQYIRNVVDVLYRTSAVAERAATRAVEEKEPA
jgi:uncharacterized RDD family membrane protein YckC